MESPVEVGDVVAGKFAVERILACGGSGVVVLARHLTLLEPCAIKLMRPEALEAPMARERFLREARAAARLKSEHVVKVFDVGQLEDETPYMVMEYVEGTDLEEMVLQRGALPVPEAALYMMQICAALAEAHRLGIVHRDLKPANVLVTHGADGAPRVKLVDFGISKLLHDPNGTDPMTTLQGTVMGTPAFMAPEQINATTIDTRTDIWAIGALLYHLVTGALPFPTAEAIIESLAIVLTTPAIPPSRHVRGIPPALEQLILRCLEKRPDDRPASVTEIAEALAPFARSEMVPLPDQVRRIRGEAPEAPREEPTPVPQKRDPAENSRLAPTLLPAELARSATTGAPPAAHRWVLTAVVLSIGAVALVVVLAFALRAPPAPMPTAAVAPVEVAPVPHDAPDAAAEAPAPATSEPPAPTASSSAPASPAPTTPTTPPKISRPASFGPTEGFNLRDRR
jgi:serine/threonine-protein kinase